MSALMHMMSLQEQAKQHAAAADYQNRSLAQGQQQFTAGHEQLAAHQAAQFGLEQDRLREMQDQHDAALQMQRRGLFTAKQEKDQALVQHAFELNQHNRLEGQRYAQRNAADIATHFAALGQTDHPVFKSALEAMSPELAQNAVAMGKATRLNTLQTQLGTFLSTIKDPTTLAKVIGPLKAGFAEEWNHPTIQAMLQQMPVMDKKVAPVDMSNEFIPSAWNTAPTTTQYTDTSPFSDAWLKQKISGLYPSGAFGM